MISTIETALNYERKRALKYGYNTLFDDDFRESKEDLCQDIALSLLESGELNDFEEMKRKATYHLTRYTREHMRRTASLFDIDDYTDLRDPCDDYGRLECLEKDIRGLNSYSESQIEIMIWISQGIPQKDMAERKGVSAQAISKAIDRIRMKAEGDERLYELLIS